MARSLHRFGTLPSRAASRLGRCAGAAGLLLGLLLPGGCTPERGAAVPKAERPLEQSGPAGFSPEARRMGAERLLVRALAAMQQERFEDAAAMLQEALLLVPGEPTLLATLAEAYSAQGDFEAARYYLAEATERDPHQPAFLMQLGALHRASGDPAGAAEAFERALVEVPNDRRALAELADAQDRAGDLSASIDSYNRLLHAGADPAAVHVRLHRLYMATADAEGAIRNMRALIELDPENADYRRTLDQLLAANEENVSGRRVTPGVPGTADPGADARELIIGADSSRWAQAEVLLGNALQAEPRRADLLQLRALLLERRLRFAEAAGVLYEVVAQSPREIELWARASRLYTRSGRADRGLAVAEEGALLFPSRVDLLTAAGEAALALSDTDAARRFAEQALERLRVTSEGGTDALADLLAQVGRRGTADSLYLAMLDRNAAPEVRASYALFLAGDAARLQQALEEADAAYAEDLASPHTLHALGWVHVRLGNTDEGVRLLEEAAQLPGAGSGVFEHLGEALWERQAFGEAETFWQEGLRREPGSPSLRAKLLRLRQRKD